MKLVIFVGGTGTRMWPMSRTKRPKQFQALIGEKSMFRQSLERFQQGFKTEDIFILTGQDYQDVIREEAPELPQENIILEPEMRDTTAAVGYAAAYLDKKFPGDYIGIIWGADHVIKDNEKLIQAIKTAQEIAESENKIVEIDVRPTSPDVNLGYIQIGEQVTTKNGFEVFKFIRQVEKPDLKAAKRFFQSFNYLWHTGYAVWNTSKMMTIFEKYAPDIYLPLKKIHEAIGTDQEKAVLIEEYPKIPKISIDFSIYEKLPSEEILVIPADIGWSDIGAWNILKNELSDNGNIISIGDHIDHDSHDILVINKTPKKLIATIGLEGVIIVDTPDALLILPQDRSQDVKKIVEKLKEANRKEFL